MVFLLAVEEKTGANCLRMTASSTSPYAASSTVFVRANPTVCRGGIGSTGVTCAADVVVGLSVLVVVGDSVASVAMGVEVGVGTTSGPCLRAESRSIRCRRMPPGEAFLELTSFLLVSLGIMDGMVWEQQTVKEKCLGSEKFAAWVGTKSAVEKCDCGSGRSKKGSATVVVVALRVLSWSCC